MTWWSWMILGAVILGAELFAIDAQFYLFFLGVSAALVGLAGLLGVTIPEWAQWMSFAAISLVSMFTFRKALYEKVHGGALGYRHTIAGGKVDVESDLEVGNEVRVEYRGSTWTARNTGEAVIPGGSRAKVVKAEGLTLHVEAE